MSHFTGGPDLAQLLENFTAVIRMKGFVQMFTKVNIRKTKISGLEELKILFRVVEERILSIYKS